MREHSFYNTHLKKKILNANLESTQSHLYLLIRTEELGVFYRIILYYLDILFSHRLKRENELNL